MKELKVGKGTGTLMDWDEDDTYTDIAADICHEIEYQLSDLIFLNDLRNGSEKGAGLAVLKKALEEARHQNGQLVVFVQSGSDQDKLRNWYLSTGLLVQIPKRNGSKFANLLIDKESECTLRTEDPNEDDLL